jgi:hypothetical protein
MMTQTLAAEWDDYIAVLREDAHQLLAWSYADTRTALSKSRDEYDMTGLLANAMHERINDPETPDRFTFYSVHNERPIGPTGEQGKDRPKLDIQIERCGIRPKKFYTVEAKRLRDDEKASRAASIAHYFGEDGVGRFVSGRYEADNIEAAMLGCIQAHNAHFWFQQIEKTFADDIISGRNKFNVIERFRPYSVIDEIADEASTIHRRLNGSSIRLLHILLDCT